MGGRQTLGLLQVGQRSLPAARVLKALGGNAIEGSREGGADLGGVSDITAERVTESSQSQGRSCQGAQSHLATVIAG